MDVNIQGNLLPALLLFRAGAADVAGCDVTRGTGSCSSVGVGCVLPDIQWTPERVCQGWINAGPASRTLAQHLTNLRSVSGAWWIRSGELITGLPAGHLVESRIGHRLNNLLNPQSVDIFCIKHVDQRVLSIWNHYKCLSQLFPLHLNTYMLISPRGLGIYFRVLLYYVKYMYVLVTLINNYLLTYLLTMGLRPV